MGGFGGLGCLNCCDLVVSMRISLERRPTNDNYIHASFDPALQNLIAPVLIAYYDGWPLNGGHGLFRSP
ncbi:hypothetical protein ACMD2_07060 [Ananas comosus]|uniref:Uncharacterized protein n=1 Tax=Ananas comosus TaxID=4615 RepID=A0A199VJ08_ANACO|nr:hypothetical protein ACMD2_07060 [Ananas comosus]